MSSTRKKLLVAGIGLLAAVSYLAIAGAKSGWVYFVDVDHFMADSRYTTQRVRLHGKVADEDFTTAGIDARFILLGKDKRLGVNYHGVIPEMFQVGKEVVVEGRLDAAGIFKADLLMTKCASKYEPNSPHQSAAGGDAKERS
jgi:cytochrome c-type biogenesis protein CcmE